jgi:hypothetical protein
VYIKKSFETELNPAKIFEDVELARKNCSLVETYLGNGKYNYSITKLGYSPNKDVYKQLVESVFSDKFEIFDFENRKQLDRWIEKFNSDVVGINFHDPVIFF